MVKRNKIVLFGLCTLPNSFFMRYSKVGWDGFLRVLNTNLPAVKTDAQFVE